MLVRGGHVVSLHTPALHHTHQGAARNRMLVKGGSAFNGLRRAMKQDLVEGGAGASAARRDPNTLYEVGRPAAAWTLQFSCSCGLPAVDGLVKAGSSAYV